jgi:hypothetical protein
VADGRSQTVSDTFIISSLIISAMSSSCIRSLATSSPNDLFLQGGPNTPLHPPTEHSHSSTLPMHYLPIPPKPFPANRSKTHPLPQSTRSKPKTTTHLLLLGNIRMDNRSLQWEIPIRIPQQRQHPRRSIFLDIKQLIRQHLSIFGTAIRKGFFKYV